MNSASDRDDSRAQRVNAVLGAYLEAADAGWAPAPEYLLARYPDLAGELQSFFAIQDRVAALASPLPYASPSANGAAGTNQREPNTVVSNRVPPRAKPPAPQRIGEYESVELIKEAGMGAVYKAWQKGANRWVALKVIRDGQFASDDEIHRFRREAEAVANLDHPHIVPIYEVGEHDGLPFFSMKLLEAGTLHEHLEKYSADLRSGVKLLAQVCKAVHYAHQRGILHRDLKPANILLDADGHPHVADFGLAKRMLPECADPAPSEAAHGASAGAPTHGSKQKTTPSLAPERALAGDHTAASLSAAPSVSAHSTTIDLAPHFRTQTHAVFGTFGYMPPEQAGMGKGSVSVAGDVFSLGAILYQLLTGELPFATRPREEALKQIRACQPAPPRTRHPRVDRRLEAVCMKCLHKEPAERYVSAAALAEDLERWLAGDWPQAWTPPRHLRALRALRRHPVISASVVFNLFAAAALAFLLYYFHPDRIPDELERASQRGPVVLIAETGPPRWTRWNAGEATVLISPEANLPYCVSTLENGRVELLRRAPGPRYRYAAEVRHEKALVLASLVGIYFANSEIATATGVKRYWWDLPFAEFGVEASRHTGPDKRKYSEVSLIPRRYVIDDRPARRFIHPSAVRKKFLPAQSQKQALAVWHKLEVKVTPEKIELCWDGDCFAQLTPDEVRELGAPSIHKGEVIFPEIEFNPEGGLGIFVNGGRASFRNVIVEPLK